MRVALKRVEFLKAAFQKFRYRKVMLALADAFIIGMSALIAADVLSLLEDGISDRYLWISIFMTIITCMCGLSIFGAYSKLWRYFNRRDYLSCVDGVIFGAGITCMFAYILRGSVPLRYEMLHSMVAIVGICLFRYIFKCTFIDLIKAGKEESAHKRTMIIGGGQACRTIINEIHNAQHSPYTEDKSTAIFEPVCIIDDNRDKIGSSIDDVQIVGTTVEIHKFITEFDIEQILFCIPSCLEDERKRILDICSGTKLPIKVIPFLGNLIFDENNPTLLGQVRDI